MVAGSLRERGEILPQQAPGEVDGMSDMTSSRRLFMFIFEDIDR